MNIKRGTRGMTIIEILVSISITALIGIVLGQVFFSTTSVNTKTQTIKQIRQNGDFAMFTMTNAIHQAASVSACLPGMTTLTIINTDGSTTIFTSAANRIQQTKTAGTDYLTDTSVVLGTACGGAPAFQFNCTAAASDLTQFEVQVRYCLQQPGTPGAQYERANQYFTSTIKNRN